MRIEKARRGSVIAGTGFIPLDIVYRDDARERLNAHAGGTCGNVMAILAFLGWQSFPVARHDHGPIAGMIKNDLQACGVRTDFLSTIPTAVPPVVVQRIFSKPRGLRTHSFSWTCPGCGAHLPSYKPVLAQNVPNLIEELPTVKAFFFDRVSRAALDLAAKIAETDGVVIFEPSMIGEPKLFAEALSICHIFKYSQDRIANVNELRGSADPLIEIETLGSAGLRYRFGKRRWAEMGAYSIAAPVDTSGAGDWFTAGVVHGLCQAGARGLLRLDNRRVKQAVQLGQAMATWNCQFPAARGGMYGTTWNEWKASILHVLKFGSTSEEPALIAGRPCPEILFEICCEKKDKQMKERPKSEKAAQVHGCVTLRQGGSLGKALSR